MAYIPPSNSVVAFQSDPNKLVGKVSVTAIDWGNSSLITVGSGTTGNSSVQIVGQTPPASVSGVGTFNINPVGAGSVLAVLTNSSVAALQGTNPWKVELTSGSVITSGGNSSVQVNNIVTGNSSVYLIPGVGVLGSVAALQGTNPWKVELTSGSIITAGSNSSVQVNNIVTGNSSVYLIPGVGVLGSVAALQGSNPWKVELTSGSIITAGGNSSVQVNNIVTGNSSVYLIPGVGILGSIATLQGTNPWLIQVRGSVLNQYAEDVVATSVVGIPLVFRRTDSASIMGIVSPANPLPVAGSIVVLQGTSPLRTVTSISGGISSVTQAGNWNMGPSSVELMTTSASIAVQVNRILQGASSVQLMTGIGVIGSVAVLQGTNPWVVGNSSVQVNNIVTGNSSVYLIPGVGILGSVATLQGTSPWVTVTQASSIVGTYAEDSAHTTADKGVFALQVRNDTMASITSADGDYSPQAVGPVGEVIVGNSPITKWISGQACVFSGTSVQVIAAQGASIFTYITGINIVNDSANNSKVKITCGNGSVLAFTVAPANGGSNIIFANGLKTAENQGVSASVGGTAVDTRPSVYITLTGFIAKI